ncbi:MAG: hypothetical protein JSV77_01485 [Dehalococcoidales bacterium]|nr:MAG: hypothetical protein JSV77_01485 [Dehalococcoidales bacterium]
MMVTRARRVFAIVRFGLLVLRWCGLRIFLRKMVHQLYGQTVFLITTGQLGNLGLSSSFQCTVSLASPDDVEELFSKLSQESPEGRYQLLVRKWYHELGFGDCYVSRASDTNEICVVCWFVTSRHIEQLRWEDRFSIEEEEIMIENVYVFERYRGTGAHATFGRLVWEMARQLGYRYRKAYIDETNIPERRFMEKNNSRVSARILERHILLCVTRKTLERYAPSIPMKAPPDS